MSAAEGGSEGLEERFEWCVWWINKHHALNEKDTWNAFAPKTTSQQPCSVVARPAEPHSHLMTCWAGKWMEISKVWKNATVVDFTVWILEGLWGTAVHSREQRSYVGQLVSTHQQRPLSFATKAIGVSNVLKLQVFPVIRSIPQSLYLSSLA